VTNLEPAFSVIQSMRRAVLTGIAAAVLVTGSFAASPLRQAPATAYRFVVYLGRMERSGQELGFWDRVTYGLVLAGSMEKKKGGPTRAALL
jgi:hypothetical protein